MLRGTDPVALAHTISLFLSVAFITYLSVIVVPFLRRQARPSGDGNNFSWHLLVPACDEEAVIGDTVAYLREQFPAAHLWVVDDASEDATADIVARLAARDDHVRLVRRRRPQARVGKGAALNDGFGVLDGWLAPDVDRRRVIVGVVDADGRPGASCLDVCAGPELFGDPRVGAVQIDVRMSNRDDPMPRPGRGRWTNAASRALVRMQDIDFRAGISAIQGARRKTGSVCMGGNGQFSRLSALDDVIAQGGGPWRGSLLEDFEIGVHVLMAGWRTEFTADAWVDQEAPVHFGRFVHQRTRWAHGAMQCGRYVPDLWRAPAITNIGAIELLYYLAQPWLNMVGTIVFPIPMAVFFGNAIRNPEGMRQYLLADGGWALVLLYLVFGVGAFAMWGFAYRRKCEPTATRRQALLWGLGFWIYSYGVYAIVWRAVWRIAHKQNAWVKTRRNAEGSPMPQALPTVTRPIRPAWSFPRIATLVSPSGPVPIDFGRWTLASAAPLVVGAGPILPRPPPAPGARWCRITGSLGRSPPRRRHCARRRAPPSIRGPDPPMIEPGKPRRCRARPRTTARARGRSPTGSGRGDHGSGWSISQSRGPTVLPLLALQYDDAKAEVDGHRGSGTGRGGQSGRLDRAGRLAQCLGEPGPRRTGRTRRAAQRVVGRRGQLRARVRGDHHRRDRHPATNRPGIGHRCSGEANRGAAATSNLGPRCRVTLVLDTAALIALERNERAMWTRLKAAQLSGVPPATHGGVLGQAWRGGPRQARLSRGLRGLDVRPLDETLGRRAGELLGAAGLSDVVDAAVVLLADDGDEIVTSDHDDFEQLARASGRHVELLRP